MNNRIKKFTWRASTPRFQETDFADIIEDLKRQAFGIVDGAIQISIMRKDIPFERNGRKFIARVCVVIDQMEINIVEAD